MSTTATILTIWADEKLKEKFKESWRKFNENRMGTVTQAEYLEHLLDSQSEE